jgi:hypothetical protein
MIIIQPLTPGCYYWFLLYNFPFYIFVYICHFPVHRMHPFHLAILNFITDIWLTVSIMTLLLNNSHKPPVSSSLKRGKTIPVLN